MSEIYPVSLMGTARSTWLWGGEGRASSSPKQLGGPSLDGDKSYFPPDSSSSSATEVENRGHDLPHCPLILLIENLRLVWCSQVQEPGIPAHWELRCVAGSATPGYRIWPRGCNPQPLSEPEPMGFTSPKRAKWGQCFLPDIVSTSHHSLGANAATTPQGGAGHYPVPKRWWGELLRWL